MSRAFVSLAVLCTLACAPAAQTPAAPATAMLAIAAFAEGDAAPEIPGPLIRVRTGTMIDASVRNALVDSTITVRGLVTPPASAPDSLVAALRRAPGRATVLRGLERGRAAVH